MTWTKPANFWQWLLLFTPALVDISVPLLCALLIEPLLYPDANSGLGYALLGWGWIGLLIALLVSLVLGQWLARNNDSFAKKALAGAVCTLVIIIVNGFIAFAGCAAVASIR